jgi:hypothetical protein
VAKNAGLTPFAAVLKPASMLAEEDTTQKQTLDQLADGAKAHVEAADSSPNLTFSKDSWLKFSASSSKRSTELKKIDDAFDAFAGAKDLKSQVAATSGLDSAIGAWLAKKDGDSHRLGMVSALREQVTAHLAALQLKDLTAQVNDFKARFAQLGKDPASEKAALLQLITNMNRAKTELKDAKCVELAKALLNAASRKFQELGDLEKMKGFQADRQPVLDGPILSKATKDLIKNLDATGKPLESKAVVDALFEDFCAYGRAHWKYNTKAPPDSNLFAGATTGACGTFSTQFANLVNIVVGKKIAKYAEVSAKNFITVPLKSVRFIDPACPGNLKMSPSADPDRYFFTTHFITKTPVGEYCPTTGTKDAAVDKLVEKNEFKKTQVDGQEAYELGDERITVELNKGYGNGSLYTLKKIKG